MLMLLLQDGQQSFRLWGVWVRAGGWDMCTATTNQKDCKCRRTPMAGRPVECVTAYRFMSVTLLLLTNWSGRRCSCAGSHLTDH